MGIEDDRHWYVKTGIKITGIIVLFFITALILPRIADAAGNLNNLSVECSDVFLKSSLSHFHQSKLMPANWEYEPPNFGGPDSQYGSGTR